MSQDNRTITSIILGIEADVKLLMKLYNNVDSNLIIILSNINISKKQPVVQQTQVSPAPTRVNYPPAPAFPPKPTQPKINPKIDEEGMALIEKLSKEKAQKGFIENKDAGNGTKTQVIQTINYPDGRKLFLANIKIFKDGKLINQTRTSPKGKWTAPLMPGEYSIHVSKVDSDSKKLVELKYNIDVPDAKEPVELEAAIIRG